MNEIGNDLKSVRISSSVSLEEASKDTNIPVSALIQIEDGSIGSFKDIFELKSYLTTYSKYLGLDSNKVIDDFNEYMFEYTSKIPLEDLEKAIKEKNRELEEKNNENEIKVVSPYLKPNSRNDTIKWLLIIMCIVIVVALILISIIRNVVMGGSI